MQIQAALKKVTKHRFVWKAHLKYLIWAMCRLGMPIMKTKQTIIIIGKMELTQERRLEMSGRKDQSIIKLSLKSPLLLR